MLIPYGLLKDTLKTEGLFEKEGEPFSFYYASRDEEFLFMAPPDADNMVEAEFVIEQFALWDRSLADRVRRRLEQVVQEAVRQYMEPGRHPGQPPQAPS